MLEWQALEGFDRQDALDKERNELLARGSNQACSEMLWYFNRNQLSR